MSSKDFVHQINNDIFHFQVQLISSGVTQTLTPAAIKTLVIEDELDSFFHKGFIVIDNRYDAIERQAAPTVNTTTGSLSQTVDYVLQGDSRDQIFIYIYPKGQYTGPGNGNLEQPSVLKRSAIFLQATIYNIEEISSNTPDVKFKKLYFWDKYYEYLREKNVHWSTSDVIENGLQGLTTSITSAGAVAGYSVESVDQYSDVDRAIPTGAAIKAFLGAAFPAKGYEIPAFFPSTTFGTDDTKNGRVSTETSKVQIIPDDKYWDIGATKIFFSTPARYKAIDSLNYLLSRHVSTIDNLYDQTILRIDRYTRCFTFIPLTKYFSNAFIGGKDLTDSTGETQLNAGGDFYIETIKLGGYYTDANANGTIPQYKKAYTPNKYIIQLEQTGTADNFKLEPSVGGVMQREFNTKMVHSYDSEGKQFQVDLYYNNIRQIVASYFTNYVNTIKPNMWTNLTPGTLRTSNINVEHKFSVIEQDSEQRISQGRNKALYASIFANNVININLQGSTFRQAGRFIGVDRDGSSPYSNYDAKALGIYLLTGVKHIFENNSYSNELIAMKTYTEFKILADQVGPGNENIETQANI
jgi:hypothetical protein